MESKCDTCAMRVRVDKNLRACMFALPAAFVIISLVSI